MLDVSSEARNLYVKSSVKKEIIVSAVDTYTDSERTSISRKNMIINNRYNDSYKLFNYSTKSLYPMIFFDTELYKNIPYDFKQIIVPDCLKYKDNFKYFKVQYRIHTAQNNGTNDIDEFSTKTKPFAYFVLNELGKQKYKKYAITVYSLKDQTSRFPKSGGIASTYHGIYLKTEDIPDYDYIEEVRFGIEFLEIKNNEQFMNNFYNKSEFFKLKIGTCRYIINYSDVEKDMYFPQYWYESPDICNTKKLQDEFIWFCATKKSKPFTDDEEYKFSHCNLVRSEYRGNYKTSSDNYLSIPRNASGQDYKLPTESNNLDDLFFTFRFNYRDDTFSTFDKLIYTQSPKKYCKYMLFSFYNTDSMYFYTNTDTLSAITDNDLKNELFIYVSFYFKIKDSDGNFYYVKAINYDDCEYYNRSYSLYYTKNTDNFVFRHKLDDVEYYTPKIALDLDYLRNRETDTIYQLCVKFKNLQYIKNKYDIEKFGMYYNYFNVNFSNEFGFPYYSTPQDFEKYNNSVSSEDLKFNYEYDSIPMAQKLNCNILSYTTISSDSETLLYEKWAEYYLNERSNRYKEVKNSMILGNEDLVSESFSLTESLCSTENLKFGCCESSYCDFTYRKDFDLTGRKINVNHVIYDENNNVADVIKLGLFNVTDTKKQYFGTKIQRGITAYDGLYKLNENAMDWYTQYMFGVTTTDYEDRYGIEYPRQLFSTYYNFAKNIGIEDNDFYNYELISSLDRNNSSDMTPNPYVHIYDDTNQNTLVHFSNFSVLINNGTTKYYDYRKPFMVKLTCINSNGYDYMIKNTRPDYYSVYDSLGRGAGTRGSILVKEELLDGKEHKYLVDDGDLFRISENTKYLVVYIPVSIQYNGIVNGKYNEPITQHADIYQCDRIVELTNAERQLMYYNWGTKEIFACESSITGRDVIQSLLELTGCFFKLDRYGKPVFKYCTKSGLYPSETLYPNDSLYPRGTDEIIGRSSYEYFHCEDYTIEDYGKIQILKKAKTNESKSVVEWNYVGDSTKRNTYLIDNNIFYCNDSMMYDYDSMPEVSKILENMFFRIKDMGYTPMEVSCIGLPYIECGDRIVLLTEDNGVESFVFSRKLKGIQGMKDMYESQGDEYTPEVNDFGYSLYQK